MSTIIKYNDIELDYPATVSITNDYIDYGGRWAAVKKVSIQGNIVLNESYTTLNDQYENLVSAQSDIFSVFQQDFKKLLIDDIEIENCKLDSLDFQESNFYGSVSFTVSLTSYPEDFFIVSTVTDPVNLITYSEQKNNCIQITRRVSARGINTSQSGASNALSNARDYINSRLGYSVGLPALTNVTTRNSYILNNNIKPKRITETIDRMNGFISVEHVYMIKSGQTGDSVMLYTIDCNYDDEKGVNTGVIRGDITGSIGQTMEELRAEFSQFSPFNKLSTYFEEMGHGTLVDQPESASINENSKDKKIEFSFSYNSMVSPIQDFEQIFDIRNDYITDTVEVTFSGKIQFKGSQEKRLLSLRQFDFSKEQAAALCQQFYAENSVASFGSSAKINPSPLSFDIKKDLINGTATISARFNNSIVPPDKKFSFYDYRINAKISTHQYALIQFLNGKTSALRYNIKNRGAVSIDARGTSSYSNVQIDFLNMAKNTLKEAINAVGGLTDDILTESKVTYKRNPDMDGYIYSATVAIEGLTGLTPKNFGGRD